MKFTDEEIEIVDQIMRICLLRLHSLVDTGNAEFTVIREYEDVCEKLMYVVSGQELQ